MCKMHPFWNLVLCFILHGTYLLCWSLFVLFQRIIWICNGTQSKVQAAKHPANYHKSTQILRVRSRHFLSPIDFPSLRNFIMTHESFTSPEYVFQNHGVSLYFFTKDYAVFCDSGEGRPLWDASYGEFFRNSAADSSKFLLLMPLSAFQRLANEVGPPELPLIFMSNTMRCGSTLMCHILNRSKQCLVIPEAEVINQLAIEYEKYGNISTPQLQQRCHDAISVLCKHKYTKDKRSIMLKIGGNSNAAIEHFARTFPNAKHIFLYRKLEDVCWSVIRMSNAASSAVLCRTLCKYSADLAAKSMEGMCFPTKHFYGAFTNDQEYGTAAWAASIKIYMDFKNRNFPIDAFRYEDLVRQPHQVMATVFKICFIDEDLVDTCLEVMNVYSQTKAFTRPENLHRFGSHKQEANMETYERILRKFSLPSLNELRILPGTLCCSE